MFQEHEANLRLRGRPIRLSEPNGLNPREVPSEKARILRVLTKSAVGDLGSEQGSPCPEW
jgi:hypothetical protein